MAKQWMATLKRGEQYVFNGKRFLKGQPLPVDDKTMKHLKQHATLRENLGNTGETVTLPQFSFKLVEAEEKPAFVETADAGGGYSDQDEDEGGADDTDDAELDGDEEETESDEGSDDEGEAEEEKPAEVAKPAARKPSGRKGKGK